MVTGAALGIGRAMCRRLAETGFSVIMADLPSDDLDEAVAYVRAVGPQNANTIEAVPTDVSDVEQIEALRDFTVQKFGHVSVLVNNAVTRTGRGFEADVADWYRAMEVNLWGPVNTVNAFMPGLLEDPSSAAIVNVGSKQGITNPPGHPIYNMTKSALKTYTEALEHHLRSDPSNQGDGRVSAHLLVPGWTTTGKAEHKPGAWLPEQVVETMITGVTAGDFYIICPDDETTLEQDQTRILWGAADITDNRPPLSRWHPEFSAAAKSAGC